MLPENDTELAVGVEMGLHTCKCGVRLSGGHLLREDHGTHVESFPIACVERVRGMAPLAAPLARSADIHSAGKCNCRSSLGKNSLHEVEDLLYEDDYHQRSQPGDFLCCFGDGDSLIFLRPHPTKPSAFELVCSVFGHPSCRLVRRQKSLAHSSSTWGMPPPVLLCQRSTTVCVKSQ